LNANAKVYQEQNGKMIALDFSAIVHAMRRHNIKQTEETVFIGKNCDFQVRLFIFATGTYTQ
jgi:predicted choloylglycine hydrolase